MNGDRQNTQGEDPLLASAEDQKRSVLLPEGEKDEDRDNIEGSDQPRTNAGLLDRRPLVNLVGIVGTRLGDLGDVFQEKGMNGAQADHATDLSTAGPLAGITALATSPWAAGSRSSSGRDARDVTSGS